jgi:hypothetical protein
MSVAGRGELEGEDEGGGTLADNKTTLDAIVGLTQIFDRNTIAQVNYSFSRGSGYLSDPYKLLSVVSSPNAASPGVPIGYLYEGRPGSRSKHAVFVHARRYIFGSTIDAAYRYYSDNWGLRSKTIDLFYRQNLGGRHAIQPHFRWYDQTAADIYRAFLVDGQPVPQHVSADYRLAAFHAYTIGVQYFFPTSDRAEFSITGEYYAQLGDRSPPDAFGSLLNVDVFPDMKVFMLRIGATYGL